MLPYWLLFLLPIALAAGHRRPLPGRGGRWSARWRIAFVVLVLLIGFRHQVGGDWGQYERHIAAAGRQSFLEAITSGDPAYSALNWWAAQMDMGPYLVNTVSALVFALGLIVFCRAQPRPWLALVVAMPYLVTVVAMGYTRQAVAIGLAMLGLAALSRRRVLRFAVCIALAALFHKSAVILMPLAILAATRNRLWTAFWVGMLSLVLYGLLLQDSVDALNRNYIEAEYDSAGAAVRIAMNALPAMLFLAFRGRFVMPAAERSFWTWMALAALVLVALLLVSPSSTAVDRIALYWIPLQLFVLSRVPHALSASPAHTSLWLALILVYSAAVLFVWLSFADHAVYWLPYRFYPLVLLWS